MEYCGCPLGCPTEDRDVIEGFDRLHGLPGRWRVVECCTCGLRRTNPRPDRHEIGRFYPEDYGPFQERNVGGPSYVAALRKSVSRSLRAVLKFEDTTVPKMPVGRLLEIGCANGDFLAEMAAKGWNVAGIEPSEAAANRARSRGFDVQCGQLETSIAPTAPYDLVVGWMALEHLHEPVVSLRRLHDWTSTGARLALSVPNAAAAEAKIFGDAWYALQLPTHLFHYAPDSLAKVLQAGGWRLTRVAHQRSVANAVASLGYWVGDRRPGSKLSQFLLNFPNRGWMHYLAWPFGALLARFGQTGRMTVWAERLPTAP